MEPHPTPDAYAPPALRELGTLSEQTLSIINKEGTSGDVIMFGGQGIPVPGSSLAN